MKANQFDIQKYCAIAAVGGDGTVSEVIDGMLKRRDKLKLPFCVIPNGSGNVFGLNFLIGSVEEALNAIKKGHVVKNDVVRVLIDYDSEQQMAEDQADSDKHLTHACAVASFGFLTQVFVDTPPFMKKVFGQLAYFITMYKMIQA